MNVITGSKGFVGQHLSKIVDAEGFNLSDGQDVRDFEQLRNYLDKLRPEKIFHLAAQAFVPESLANPWRAIETNTLGSLNLLEAVRQLGIRPKILLVGSSEEYGAADNTENSLPKPTSPYAVSKLSMTNLGLMYAKVYGLEVVVTRAFNHTGPGRGEMYAESSWAKQIAEIEAGKRQILEHGDLNHLRNYTDVRDIVEAYKLAIDLTSGIYNICSYRNITMRDTLNILQGMSPVPIQTEQGIHRSGDFSFKSPNCRKFSGLTGWKPKYTLEQTLEDLLDWWRDAIR